MFATGWDEGLDDEQLAVAMHGDAPLVVVAGAGTGKTRALTSRVASLLDRGVPPDRILLLTYTRRAASDMPCSPRAAVLSTPWNKPRRRSSSSLTVQSTTPVAAVATAARSD